MGSGSRSHDERKLEIFREDSSEVEVPPIILVSCLSGGEKYIVYLGPLDKNSRLRS